MLAASLLHNPLLGPFAVHDVFPLNTGPVILHDLVLRNQRRIVGLDALAEISRFEPPSDMEGISRVQWRARCPIQSGETALKKKGGSIPPLSEDGTQLVEALAISRGLQLGASFTLTIQGSSGQYRWDNTTTPPSILLYTFNQQVFRVLSWSTQTLFESRFLIQSLSLLTWLRTDNSENSNRSFDSIIQRYRRQYPRDQVYGETDSNRRNRKTRPCSIRGSFCTTISLRNPRKAIKQERLISKEDFIQIQKDIRDLRKEQHALNAEEYAMPSDDNDQPTAASPTSDMQEVRISAEISTASVDLDAYLERIPLSFFDHFDVPPLTAASPWKCGIDGCQQTFQTPSKEIYLGTDEYDLEALHWRQRISRHRLVKHLTQDSQSSSAREAISHLCKLEASNL